MMWYLRLAQELSPEQRGEMHSRLTREHRTSQEKAIISLVERKILDGDNLLSGPMRGGEVDLDAVITSIKTQRCIPTRDRDLGYTYLESLLSNIIHDSFPPQHINEARKVFGLDPV